MNRLSRTVVMAAVALLGVAGWAWADTGTLVVKTNDAKGSPFPGVAVQIENTRGLTPPVAKQTDATGSAIFVLPVGGGYKISVALGGYNPMSTDDVKIE